MKYSSFGGGCRTVDKICLDFMSVAANAAAVRNPPAAVAAQLQSATLPLLGGDVEELRTFSNFWGEYYSTPKNERANDTNIEETECKCFLARLFCPY